MKVLQNLDLTDLYIRHLVPYFCQGHPMQPDNFNAALKTLVAALKEVEWPECAGEQIKEFDYDNLIITNGIATIIVNKLYDGTHTIQASDIYGHLYQSDHVHFTQGMINHVNIQNAGNWSHFELEDAIKEIRLYLGRDMFAPNTLSIVSPSLSVERYEGMPCARSTNDTYIGFKVSVDGDAYWRNSLREVVVEFIFLDAGGGQIQTSWNYDGGNVVDWDISENIGYINSGKWKKGSFDGELRFYGDFTGYGNADFLIRGTAGIALNAVRVYTNDQSWMNATMTEGCRLCEWRAQV